MKPSIRQMAIPALASLLLVTACGGADESADETSDSGTETPSEDTGSVETAPAATEAPDGADDERCARNEAAGTITYLTNFQFVAAPGILDVVAADDLGYFDELCLDVDIRAGDGTNPSLVAAGTATMARVGSPNDLVVAQANGIDAVAIATYTNAPQIILMTMTDKISDIQDLEGTTLGYKGSVPPEISAMLDQAGVDISTIDTVSVGFDASILPRGQVDALTGFKSNEVVKLTEAGEDITVFDPLDYGVEAASGSIIANREFMEQHREAAADFLWATMRGLEHCEANADECLSFTEARSTAGYDLAAEAARWAVEIEQLRSTILPEGLGVQTLEQWETGVTLLSDAGVVDSVPDLDGFVDTDLANEINADGTLLSEAP